MNDMQSNEVSIEVLAASYRRGLDTYGRIPELAAWFHLPMQELRIGFREHDEAHAGISLEEMNLELIGTR